MNEENFVHKLTSVHSLMSNIEIWISIEILINVLHTIIQYVYINEEHL